MTTRREFLTIAAGSLLLADAAMLFGEDTEKPKWKVGICDWDLRVAGQPGSFAVAKELGFEGVQVSYMPSGNDSLATRANRPRFLAAAKAADVAIASFCIIQFNDRPLATTPEAEGWVVECLEAMDEMEVEMVMLPFFGNADINRHKDHQPLVIEKLKRLAPIAERKKKIISIETYLSAEDHMRIIDAVGSDAIKVYYDVRNSKDAGYDIFQEIEMLGAKKLICEFHFKENHTRLGEGDIDFARVFETVKKIDYEGWLIVESAAPGDWRESQAANAQFVKRLIGR